MKQEDGLPFQLVKFATTDEGHAHGKVFFITLRDFLDKMVTIFSSNSNRFTLTNILFPANQEPPSAITVTIGMEWNTDVVKKSIPAPYTTKVASNTNLKEIINKAADENPKGPFNKYSTTYYGGQGHFITAMNGTKEVCDQWPLTPVLRNLDLRISLFFASRCFFIYEANSEPKLITANAA